MGEDEFWARAFLQLVNQHGYEHWSQGKGADRVEFDHAEAFEEIGKRADAMTKEFRQRYGAAAHPFRETG